MSQQLLRKEMAKLANRIVLEAEQLRDQTEQLGYPHAALNDIVKYHKKSSEYIVTRCELTTAALYHND